MIKWEEKYSVGNDVCDEQHKQILVYIDELIMMQSHSSDSQATRMIAKLVDYTKHHFSREEALMETLGMPEEKINDHKKAHQAFVLRVSQLSDGLSNKTATSLEQIASFLLHWWMSHIGNTDQEYAAYIRKHNNA